jgi:hypothetical protein
MIGGGIQRIGRNERKEAIVYIKVRYRLSPEVTEENNENL